MKEAVKTGITEEERKMTTRTTETIAKSRMKSHKLLYQLKNKLTWLPILILAACQNNIIYHSYAPVPLDGWDKSDTLVYTLPNSIPAGNYEAEIGIRYQESYPYRDIWLEVSHNTKDTLLTSQTLYNFFWLTKLEIKQEMVFVDYINVTCLIKHLSYRTEEAHVLSASSIS